MSSSNTRATRSRFSSPAQNGSVNGEPSKGPAKGKESSKTFMDSWLEPEVQQKASYEEHGHVGYGVTETMMPLGMPPKQPKIILKRTGAQAAESTPEAKPKPSAAAAAASAATNAAIASSSVPSPAVESASASQTRTALPTKAPAGDDDDYDPKDGARSRRQSGRATVHKKQRRSSAGASRNSISLGAPVLTPNEKASRSSELDREKIDTAVQVAVDQALEHYRFPTAWALRTLYEVENGRYAPMFEQVFTQTAKPEVVLEFSRLIEARKREGKKDNQGWVYFYGDPSSSNPFPTNAPKPAPYAKLLRKSSHRRSHSDAKGATGEPRITKKIKTSHAGDPITPRKGRPPGSHGHHHSGKTPRSRKRARRESQASDSSLSSAMDLSSPDGSSAATESPDLSPSFRGGATVGAKSASHSATPKGRPITTRGKPVASKQPVSNTSRSKSPSTTSANHQAHPHLSPPTRHHHQTNARASSGRASMPGRVANAETFANSEIKAAAKGKKDDEDSSLDQERKEEAAAVWSRRREASRLTNGYSAEESSIRGTQEESDRTPLRTTRKTRQSLGPSLATRSTRSARRQNDDADDSVVVSPVALSLPGESSSTPDSRAATPSSMRFAKKPRVGLRVKSSPVKKKGGTAAGVPRSMGEAQSSANNSGAPKDQSSENDEYCSACGNAGDVVCCDGCPRSFHFECVDMIRSEDLPDEWYCNECLIKRYPSRVPLHTGSFASALNHLEKSIPRAFSLPKKLQNRFEGVKAGADGDYEEIGAGKVATKRKSGYDDVPDFFKQREDGQAVLCHECQKPATEIRAIIPCSACSYHWHTDCLDPPLAVPPVLKTWRCPAHVDDVLLEAPPLAPAHRYRKIKGGHPIVPAVTRGVKNNGYIELDWTEEPEDDFEEGGWPEPETFGRSYKLPVKGVVLDFIEQLRRQGAGYGRRGDEAKRVPYLSPPIEDKTKRPLPGSALNRTVEEMQLALNLTSLKQKPTEGIDQLTAALLAGAEPNVVSMMTQANATNIAAGQLNEMDKHGLQAMLTQMDAMSARIRQALGAQTPAPASPNMAAQGTTPVSEAAREEPPHKMEALGPVTEPTPPATIDQVDGPMDLD